MIAFEPDSGVFSEGHGQLIVADSIGVLLDLPWDEVRVKVRVHPEDNAGGEVDARNRLQDSVALVAGVDPVNGVFLASVEM